MSRAVPAACGPNRHALTNDRPYTPIGLLCEAIADQLQQRSLPPAQTHNPDVAQLRHRQTVAAAASTPHTSTGDMPARTHTATLLRHAAASDIPPNVSLLGYSLNCRFPPLQGPAVLTLASHSYHCLQHVR